MKLTWLLENDMSIAYQVKRDLLGSKLPNYQPCRPNIPGKTVLTF